MTEPGKEFDIDPIALSAYREIVASLHAKRVPIGFIIPPTSEPILESKRSELTRYAEILLAERHPADPVLDFNGDEFEYLRRDVSQFSDGVHLRDSAAARLTSVIDDHVRAWIAAGWLEQK